MAGGVTGVDRPRRPSGELAPFPSAPPLLYGLILLHCVVLMIGGHYTYAEVPLFEELRAAMGFERNNYVKSAHFVQGFVPAIIAREILIRARVVSTRAWLNFIVPAFCLALSASYELIEWIVAVLAGA
jgi:putative membrane protein